MTPMYLLEVKLIMFLQRVENTDLHLTCFTVFGNGSDDLDCTIALSYMIIASHYFAIGALSKHLIHLIYNDGQSNCLDKVSKMTYIDS